MLVKCCKPFLKLKNASIALTAASIALFGAAMAHAAGYFTMQGYYPSNCYQFTSDCQNYAMTGPTQRYVAGEITGTEYAAQANANVAACNAATSTCMSSPTPSPSSPSGYIFRFTAFIPY